MFYEIITKNVRIAVLMKKYGTPLYVDPILLAGAIKIKFLTFLLYSGFSANVIRGMVPPRETPPTSTLEYPVTDITRSMAAGKS